MSYCTFVNNLRTDHPDNVHVIYHDHDYGFPITDDDKLFGRLILEINQAGLSWNTILLKQQNFKKAYANFEIIKVAAFSEADRDRLMSDAGIIRNRLKINAAIHNAQVILKLQEEFGSFNEWIHSFPRLSKDEWVKIFKKHFKFVGGEIVNEFLMSIGQLPGAHEESCCIYNKTIVSNPRWDKL